MRTDRNCGPAGQVFKAVCVCELECTGGDAAVGMAAVFRQSLASARKINFGVFRGLPAPCTELPCTRN